MRPKLLLADDSVTIQRVIELTFAGEDVEVLTAGDGEQAVQRVQTDRPDIVLADIGMPKRSGYEVAAFIKGDPGLAHIPVLLLTGAFEPVDEGRARAAGCDGVLVKPFEPQHVIARVKELLEGAARQSTNRAVADVPRPVERLAPHRPVELPVRHTGGRVEGQQDRSPGGSDPGHDADAPRGAPEAALDDYFDRLDAAFANIGSQPAEQAASDPEHEVREPEVLPRQDVTLLENECDWFDSSMPSAHHAGEVIEQEPHPELTAGHVTRDVAPAPSVAPQPLDLPTTFASPPRTIEWSVPGLAAGLGGGIRHPEPPPPEPPDQSPTISPPSERVDTVDRPPPAPPSSFAPPGRGAALTVPPQKAVADAFSALLAVEQGEPGAEPVRLVTASAGTEITDELIDEITRRVIERLTPGAVNEVVSGIVTRIAERLVREEITRLRHRNPQ
jgi:CheY-like chemotaxis protein